MEKRRTTMMVLRNIFTFALLILLAGCSEPPQNTGTAGERQGFPAAHQSNESSDISIGPIHATARTVISLRTGNTAISNGDISWYVNGNKAVVSEKFRFSSDELKKGDVIQAVLVSGNKEYRSNEIKVKNTPPAIRKAQLTPDMPVVGNIIRPAVTVDDADRDNISFKYKWTLNNTFAGEDSYLDTELKRDDMITVDVTPYDGEEYGRSIQLKSRVINSLPTVSDSTPSIEGNIYKYRVQASDPDHDLLAYKLEKAPQGMIIDTKTGIITWQIRPEDRGNHEITVSVSDNKGGMIYVPVTVMIDVE
jgi:hypothetical protein